MNYPALNMLSLRNHIAGSNRPASSGATIDITEPASGAAYATVPASEAADVDAAVEAARAAFPGWQSTPVEHRSAILLRLADLITENLERLAEAESRDTGKPITLARTVDIPRAAANFRYFATAILHRAGETHEGIAGFNYTLRAPRGVAGLISPWNLPLYLLSWKIAPAIATGNTCVCKPSEVTPYTASLLADLLAPAGLPPGVVNIVHGTGPDAGGPLVTHPGVPTLSFTGSTAVGRWIGEHAGRQLKRVSLELGGKNPFVIFADADLDAAVTTAVRAAFTNQGQVCLCGSRLLVQRSVFDRVRDRVVEAARGLTPGDPALEVTRFGALTSAAHLQKVSGIVDAARALGATIHCGGSVPAPDTLPARCRAGSFYLPTVITGLDPACSVEQEEIFGPVVTMQPFETMEDALRLANGTPYGLAAAIFTRDLATSRHMAERLEAGIVWVNCWMLRDLRTPFGGARQSGVGREGGLEALRFFTEPKNICIGG
ncbi:MAG: aldehyde dehydrogenase [Phycisphaerales bacterium]